MRMLSPAIRFPPRDVNGLATITPQTANQKSAKDLICCPRTEDSVCCRFLCGEKQECKARQSEVVLPSVRSGSSVRSFVGSFVRRFVRYFARRRFGRHGMEKAAQAVLVPYYSTSTGMPHHVMYVVVLKLAVVSKLQKGERQKGRLSIALQ